MGLRPGELESATEMAAALHKGAVTAGELVERALARAEAWQPFTNAFSQSWAEEALEVAGEIDARPPQERAGPLAGIPIAVKDLYDVVGHETTGCCAAYRGTLPGRDATVIERIRRAGLVMVGKTNQHELAAGGTNLVSACGRTGNPWDPDRMTGGSSGGSAAAVACGVVPWALGSDTGGSIRIPAAMCGTFGLKPTTGRGPLDGMMPLAPSMDCPGPLAAALTDLLTLYALQEGEGGPEQPSAEGLRVGLLEGFFVEVQAEEVADKVLSAGRSLESAGVTVDTRDGGGIEDARDVWMQVCTPEFAEAHPLLREPERRRLVSPQPRSWIEQGERVTPAERAAAARRRDEIRRWYLSRLEGLDALVIPTTPYPAPRADEERVHLGRDRTVEIERVGPGFFTCSVNLAGLPALSLPGGRSPNGLPIGVSLVGRPHGEARLLRLAGAWADATESPVDRPPVPAP